MSAHHRTMSRFVCRFDHQNLAGDGADPIRLALLLKCRNEIDAGLDRDFPQPLAFDTQNFVDRFGLRRDGESCQ